MGMIQGMRTGFQSIWGGRNREKVHQFATHSDINSPADRATISIHERPRCGKQIFMDMISLSHTPGRPENTGCIWLFNVEHWPNGTPASIHRYLFAKLFSDAIWVVHHFKCCSSRGAGDSFEIQWHFKFHMEGNPRSYLQGIADTATPFLWWPRSPISNSLGSWGVNDTFPDLLRW